MVKRMFSVSEQREQDPYPSTTEVQIMAEASIICPMLSSELRG